MNSLHYFNKVASKWDQMREHFFKPKLRDKIVRLANVKTGDIVADIGAGTGFLSEGFLKYDIEILALDQSENMLHVMQNKFGFDKIKYFKGTSEAWPLPDSTVDIIVSNMFLHHVEDPKKSIKELYRILKSSGKLIISDLDRHNHSFLLKEHNDKWPGFDRSDIEKWYKQAGFQNINIQCADENCCASSTTKSERAEVSIFIAMATK